MNNLSHEVAPPTEYRRLLLSSITSISSVFAEANHCAGWRAGFVGLVRGTTNPFCFFARPRADPARKRLPLDETRPTPVLSDGELSAFADGRDREREHIPAMRMQRAARIVTTRNQSAAQREYGRVAAPREA